MFFFVGAFNIFYLSFLELTALGARRGWGIHLKDNARGMYTYRYWKFVYPLIPSRGTTRVCGSTVNWIFTMLNVGWVVVVAVCAGYILYIYTTVGYKLLRSFSRVSWQHRGRVGVVGVVGGGGTTSAFRYRSPARSPGRGYTRERESLLLFCVWPFGRCNLGKEKVHFCGKAGARSSVCILYIHQYNYIRRCLFRSNKSPLNAGGLFNVLLYIWRGKCLHCRCFFFLGGAIN